MATVRPANAGAVTRLLVKNGFRKSEQHRSGMVRGWSDFTEGVKSEQGLTGGSQRVRQGSYRDGSPRYVYRSNNSPTGYVYVEYVLSSGRMNRGTPEQDYEKQDVAMTKAYAVLVEAGYTVERYDGGGTTKRPMLKVSRTDETGEVVKF